MIPYVLFNTRKFPQWNFLWLRVQQENAWIKMNRSVSFSQFIKNDKNYKSQTPELKLQNIFFLFDNNDEGILRKHEVRQIIFTLFLIKKQPIKVKVCTIIDNELDIYK